ncbi:MAG TPA: hypothetical protein VML00_11670 [Bacteroidota bacterium]|nr:hypothetical protein [Bacteroidota bacterium]HTS00406.1 hypothetical protein [Bacteroidota bacterium]
MNKIIFQIGMLGFCVAAVVFGTQGMTLMETVARSFIVFIIVVCGLALMLFASSMIASRERQEGEAATGGGGIGAAGGAPREGAAPRRAGVQPGK